MPASVEQRLVRLVRISIVRNEGLSSPEQIMNRFGVGRVTARQYLYSVTGKALPSRRKLARLEHLDAIRKEGLRYSEQVEERFGVSNPTAILYLRSVYGELPQRERDDKRTICPYCEKPMGLAAVAAKHMPTCIHNPANIERYRAALSGAADAGVTCQEYAERQKRDKSLPTVQTLRRQVDTQSWSDVLAFFGLVGPYTRVMASEAQNKRRVALGVKWAEIIERGLSALEREVAPHD